MADRPSSGVRGQTAGPEFRALAAEVLRRRIKRVLALVFLAFFPLLSCSNQPDPNTLVMVIESSPTNLDPRVGQDAFSERIDNPLRSHVVQVLEMAEAIRCSAR